MVLKVVVSAAEVQDRDRKRLVAQARQFFHPDLQRLALVWADASYDGQLVDDLCQQIGWTVEIVTRSAIQSSQVVAVQPRCWIVE